MSTNNKISTVVSGQLPEFVRADHPTFVAFLQAYYEYLEQSNSTLRFGKTIERAKNLTNYFDVDKIDETGLDEFADKLYSQFLVLFPKDTTADKSKLLKNVKDFYRAGGTEKAYTFLMRVLFGEKPEFYYPKNDILIASSGKWVIDKVIRLTNIKYNGVANSSIDVIKKFKNTPIKGNTSLTIGNIERVQEITEAGLLYKELFLSGLNGNFSLDESVFSINIDGDTLSANILSGYVTSVTVSNTGTGYVVGSSVPLESTTGTGAFATISSVTTGNISSIFVVEGGAGFQANSFVLFSNPFGFSGTTANAKVTAVISDGSVHPNTYFICANQVIEVQNTQINLYSNSSGGNANTSIGNTLSYFALSNLGPVQTVIVQTPGSGYATAPIANTIGNSSIRILGIIGKIKINQGGSGYSNGEILEFRNVIGGYGSGANAIVTVNGTGSIVDVELKPKSNGLFVGGSGYETSYLPKIEISNTSGTGANLEVQALLGFGDILNPITGTIGQIISIRVDSPGSGYETAPVVNLTSLGDGTATAFSNVATGFITKPGRYLDDTGKLSSTNHLQDRDYYQRYSYVIKLNKSLSTYKKYLLDLVHPAGTKLWSEYLYDADPDVNVDVRVADSNVTSTFTYVANAISFNGSNSSLYKINTLNGIANTTTGTVSFWLNPVNLTNNYVIFSISNTASSNSPKFEVRLVGRGNANSYIEITGRNHVNTILLRVVSNTGYKILSNTWHHVMSSWDLANTSNTKILIDGVNTTNLIHNWIYTGNSYNTSTQSPFTSGIYFKPDGTKMYTTAVNRILEYTLSTPWNLNTASFTSNTSVDSNILYGIYSDLFWKEDGTKLYTTTREDIVTNVTVVASGSGFRVNDAITFTNPSGFSGITATAKVLSVNSDGSVHPNSYLICANTISEVEATAIGLYSNTSGGNANTSMANTLSYYAFELTGPVANIIVTSNGLGYLLPPSANILGNTAIRNLGIVGSIKINDGGTGYANGDVLVFTTVLGNYGYGANGVAVVNATGTIIRTELTPISNNYTVGGTGYANNYFPTISVQTVSGNGASLEVLSLLGSGDILSVVTGNTNNVKVVEYNANSSWNLQSINISSGLISKNIALQEIQPSGIYFSNTGNSMFIVGANSTKVHQYSLSTPWNVNTASYTANVSILSQETDPSSLAFGSNGRYMYVLGATVDSVHEYYLNTPWDITTTVYNRTFDIGDDLNYPSGLYIDLSNNRIFVSGINTAATTYPDSWTSIRQYRNSRSNTFINNRNTTGQYNLIDYKGSNVSISGTSNNTNTFYGCLTDFWFVDRHLNLSNNSILNNFYYNYLPGYIENDITYGTNVSPIIFITNDYLTANVNRGTGGNFNFANNVANCSLPPLINELISS